MNKKLIPVFLASASLFMASCGKPATSSSSKPVETTSETEEFKVSRAFRYLDYDLQEIAECDNAGWYYKPIESLDYDVYADIMMKNSTEEEVPEETETEPEIATQADEEEEEVYVYNPEDWTGLGIGLDIEDGSLMLNGRKSSSISGLTGELLLNEVKLWEVTNGIETYQKVSGIKGYLDGETSALYVDLSNASLLRLALVELVREGYPGNDEWNLASKTKISMDETDTMLLGLMMPWSDRSASLYTRVIESIKTSYGEEGSEYCYFDNSKVKTGYYLNWIVNDFSTLTDMLGDIIDGTSYPTVVKNYAKDYIESYADYVDDFKMNLAFSWTQDELRSVSMTVQAKLNEEKIISELTADSSIYIKNISFEGKFMPLTDKAAEFSLPNLDRYEEMQEIVGLTDQERPGIGDVGDTSQDDIDAYIDAIKDWIENNGGEGGDGDGWIDEVRDWISGIIG